VTEPDTPATLLTIDRRSVAQLPATSDLMALALVCEPQRHWWVGGHTLATSVSGGWAVYLLFALSTSSPTHQPLRQPQSSSLHEQQDTEVSREVGN